MRTASIYLTETHLGRTTLLGRRVERRRTGLARIVLMRKHYAGSVYKPDGYDLPIVSFQSATGDELFYVSSRW
jgi:hypothetical protein